MQSHVCTLRMTINNERTWGKTFFCLLSSFVGGGFPPVGWWLVHVFNMIHRLILIITDHLCFICTATYFSTLGVQCSWNLRGLCIAQGCLLGTQYLAGQWTFSTAYKICKAGITKVGWGCCNQSTPHILCYGIQKLPPEVGFDQTALASSLKAMNMMLNCPSPPFPAPKIFN